jgi:hypothetical protein
MSTPTKAYTRDRIGQLAAACRQRDGETAVAVIELVRADGYNDLADQLVNSVVEQGLQSALGVTR